ncbi:MAG TPA: 4-hydroxy-tetrahydrodipicolinate reductase [Alphaproteobacteria bacterium]|mgnify:CR=1 FL=1|nr:4-hydroxy-tetrahydrodipicolinate reductase [Rhodospirillaceae bacterium]HRJ11850.1 4-hydroxy-tetrahydrodipicolinate reductase [Alphaproteobacteria bacterium]
MIHIAINGSAGRMGQTLAKLINDAPRLQLSAQLDTHNIGTLPDALKNAQVIIDFSVPEATIALCQAAADAGVALVIGTTGISAEQEKIIHAAAKKIPVVYSGNYSLGVNVLATLVERAAASLPPELFDIEIFESHHKHKVDAPSGTAMMLGRAAAEARGKKLDDIITPARHGHTGARSEGSIGFSVARGGDVAGDHTVYFYGLQERLELTHRATDRAIFARGALHAARWVTDKPAGLYTMRDVLGLT